MIKALTLGLVMSALTAQVPYGCDCYNGAPNLALTVSVMQAGGGPQHFRTMTLFRALAGPLAGAERFRLRMMFGNRSVASFEQVFDFMVSDLVSSSKRERVVFPAVPAPDPRDAKALAAALLAGATVSPGTYSVNVLLDRLLSHSLHLRISADIARRYGAASEENYRRVLLQALLDMKRANHL